MITRDYADSERNDCRDHDAEYEACTVRGADACHCGGVPVLLPGGTLGSFATVKPAIQCRGCNAMTIQPDGGMPELIAEWNKGVARRKFLQDAIRIERQENCAHSWFRQSDGEFRCTHCGKDFPRLEPVTTVLLPAPTTNQ